MISHWLLLTLIYLCSGTKALAQTAHPKSFHHVPKKGDFLSATLGDKVTFQCFYDDGGDLVMFYWYKQILGLKPSLMSSYYKYKKNSTFHNSFKNDVRLAVVAGKGKLNLTITNLHISDSASYYCAGSNMLILQFFEGTTISVRGSGINIPASIHQSPSLTIQPGEELTLNCTVDTRSCGGQHSVYWYRNSEEYNPGLIYTQGGKNDQCRRKNTTQTSMCVFNLPLNSLDISNAETFYCAVVACGHVLFGNGTKINIQEPTESVLLLVFLVCSLAITVILVVLLAYAAWKMSKRNSCQCRVVVRSAAQTSNTDETQDPNNLQYAALMVQRKTRSRSQRNETRSECIYSSVKN